MTTLGQMPFTLKCLSRKNYKGWSGEADSTVWQSLDDCWVMGLGYWVMGIHLTPPQTFMYV